MREVNPVEHYYCSQCEEQLHEGFDFCPLCGAEVVTAVVTDLDICPHCGEELEDWWTYCGNCGIDIENWFDNIVSP